MSEVKRYSLTLHKVKGKFKSPEFKRDNGEWVKFDDYARLKAEVERLRSSSFVTAVSVEQYERVIKAGDAMASSLGNGGVIVSGYILADEWLKAKFLAAKEGKPSI